VDDDASVREALRACSVAGFAVETFFGTGVLDRPPSDYRCLSWT